MSLLFSETCWELSPPGRMLPASRALLSDAYSVLLCSVPRMLIYVYLPVTLWMCWKSSIMSWLCFPLVMLPISTPLSSPSLCLYPFLIFLTFPSFMDFFRSLTPSGSDPEIVTICLTVGLQKTEFFLANLCNRYLLFFIRVVQNLQNYSEDWKDKTYGKFQR